MESIYEYVITFKDNTDLYKKYDGEFITENKQEADELFDSIKVSNKLDQVEQYYCKEWISEGNGNFENAEEGDVDVFFTSEYIDESKEVKPISKLTEAEKIIFTSEPDMQDVYDDLVASEEINPEEVSYDDYYTSNYDDSTDILWESFEDEIEPMIEKQCNEDILIFSGTVGRWNGNPQGGKVLDLSRDNFTDVISGDIDTVNLISDNGNLRLDLHHHDGVHKMYLYTIPTEDTKLKELAKACGYVVEDYESDDRYTAEDYMEQDFMSDIYNGYADDLELCKHTDLLIPIKDTLTENKEIKTEAKLTDYIGIMQIQDLLNKNKETANKEFAVVDDMEIQVGSGNDTKIYKAIKNDDGEWELRFIKNFYESNETKSYKDTFIDYCKDKVKDLGTIEVKNADYDEEDLDDQEYISANVLMTADGIRQFSNVKVIAREGSEDDDWEQLVVADKDNNIVIESPMIDVVWYATRMEFTEIDKAFYNNILEYWEDGNYDEYFEDLKEESKLTESVEEEIPLVNSEDREYYTTLYLVSLWRGVGPTMVEFKVYANYEEQALEILTPYLEENAPGLLIPCEEVDIGNEEDADLIYIDGTEYGASQPYYVYNNAHIEEIEEEPITESKLEEDEKPSDEEIFDDLKNQDETKTEYDYLTDRIGQELTVGELNTILQSIFGHYNKLYLLASEFYNLDPSEPQEINIFDDGDIYTLTYTIKDIDKGTLEITDVELQ